MLKGNLIHPEIMAAIALCGHGDKILIADGNYPLAAKSGSAKKVYLGLKPGLPSVIDVLDSLKSAVTIEKAEVMAPDDGTEPEVFAELSKSLNGLPLDRLERYVFYDACGESCVRLAISSGEKRTFANILITVGTV